MSRFSPLQPTKAEARLLCCLLGLFSLGLFRSQATAVEPTPGAPALIAAAEPKPQELYPDPIDVVVPPLASDKSVKLDYDIVYVRAGRAGDTTHKRYFTDFSQPVTMEPGADLMLLHPDGSEELLVAGGYGSVTDPMVSFDGQWVYYSLIHNLVKRNQWSPPKQGADIYKIHLASRKIVRLTNQRYSPNTGVGDWTDDFRAATGKSDRKDHLEPGVFNMGPCPLPGGKIVFTTNRDGFRPAKGYPRIALQLFVMDDRDESLGDDEDPQNLEKIGHLNISGALHPVILADGRIMFSSLESQGLRDSILWGIWTIRPDGTQWNPLVSAFDPGGAPNGFHFQTQLSDSSIVFEEYYNQNNSGFGTLLKMPASPPRGQAAFGPGDMQDARNKPWREGRHYNAKPQWYRMPFMPTGSVSLTPFTHGHDAPAGPSDLRDKTSPAVGKFTHPSGAPDNHLLTCYSPGPTNHQYTFNPQLDGGLYLLKQGQSIESPSQMLLIKNDPKYNECWPRAVVPYEQIYGIKEPKLLPAHRNDGRSSPHLPEGTPFGIVGSSSLYKRESYPNGRVPEGKVTAEYRGGNDPWRGLDAFTSHGNGMPLNWHNQGGDVGLYQNDEIHALRILAMEPTTDRRGPGTGRGFYNHANERLRILGEIPVRKFAADGQQPLDPDGNPDTSFLVKLPADTAFTFQTLDKRGLMLNSAQTWHQLRGGEKRHDCGGCHAHSQQPTPFEKTAAALEDYKLWDLTESTPLLADKPLAESSQQWDREKSTGLRTVKQAVVNVEYYRDIQPILARSCTACHTKTKSEPAGNLVLDADDEQVAIENKGKFPGTYVRLAADEKARFGHKPVGYDTWGYPNASRYIRSFQARRSLLVWKIFGERLDGFSNDDHPSEAEPGDRMHLRQRGEEVPLEKNRHRWDLDYVGSQMPPPRAVVEGLVKPLTAEDWRAITRWIDLGCPIDLDYDPAHPEERGRGWMLDDNRPVLTLATPTEDHAGPLDRIVVGAYDYGTGIKPGSLSVKATFAVANRQPGEELADLFQAVGAPSHGIWEYKLPAPLELAPGSKLTVTVADGQRNLTKIERTFKTKTQVAARSP